MADQYQDPSGSTEAFRAFVHTPEPAARKRPVALIAGVAIAVLVVLAVVLWLALA